MKKNPVVPFLLLLAAVTGCFIWSCNDDSQQPNLNNTDYFPLEVGNYIIYQIDSVRYDDFNDVVIQRTLFVREIIESIFIDASGKESFRVERQYRNNAITTWGTAGFDIWSASFDGNNAERVEENQRYIKIAFPARLNKTWLGNIHINVDPDGPLSHLLDWEYEITAIDEAQSIGAMSFDSTMTIIQQAEGTAIDTVGSREVYAKGVGLVYKEIFVLQTQCTDCDPTDIPCIMACQSSTWEEKAEKGFIMKQTILEYGTL